MSEERKAKREEKGKRETELRKREGEAAARGFRENKDDGKRVDIQRKCL